MLPACVGVVVGRQEVESASFETGLEGDVALAFGYGAQQDLSNAGRTGFSAVRFQCLAGIFLSAQVADYVLDIEKSHDRFAIDTQVVAFFEQGDAFVAECVPAFRGYGLA